MLVGPNNFLIQFYQNIKVYIQSVEVVPEHISSNSKEALITIKLRVIGQQF